VRKADDGVKRSVILAWSGWSAAALAMAWVLLTRSWLTDPPKPSSPPPEPATAASTIESASGQDLAQALEELTRRHEQTVSHYEELVARLREQLTAPPAAKAATPSPDGTAGQVEGPEHARQLEEHDVAFEAAMDREFNRLEAREVVSQDLNDLAIIDQLKERLEELDAVRARVDAASSPEEMAQAQQAFQKVAGEVIQLSQADRQYRLRELAKSLGVTQPDQVQALVNAVDTIYRETDTDWPRLFSRGPIPQDAPVSPGPVAP